MMRICFGESMFSNGFVWLDIAIRILFFTDRLRIEAI